MQFNTLWNFVFVLKYFIILQTVDTRRCNKVHNVCKKVIDFTVWNCIGEASIADVGAIL